MGLTLKEAYEMAEALTTDSHNGITTLGSSGDEVAILLLSRVVELETWRDKVLKVHPNIDLDIKFSS